MPQREMSRRHEGMDAVLAAVLLLTAPFFLFPSLKTVWMLGGVPVVLVIRWMMRGNVFPRTAADPALIILAFQTAVCCFLVPDLSLSLPKVTGLIFGLLLFYITADLLATEKRLKLGTAGLFIGGLGLSLVGLTGMSWDYDSLVFSLVRLTGINLDKTAYTRKVIPVLNKLIPSFGWNLPGAESGFNANAIGGMLILVIPLGWVLSRFFIRKKKDRERYFQKPLFGWVWTAAMVISVCVLILTLSVAGWAALVLAIWVVLFSRRAKIVSLAGVVVLLALIFLLFPGRIKTASDRVSGELDYEKIEQRLDWWELGIRTVSRRPVFGAGMNRMRLHPDVGFQKAHLHNHLLHTAAEMGIPALIAYLALLMGAGLMCVQTVKKTGRHWIRQAALGLGCGQLAHFFFGWVDSIPLGAKVGIVFWLSLGIIAALYLYTVGNPLKKRNGGRDDE